ncbi:ATP-binding protein [Nocardia sp. NPDC020380]|uniref:ATP-binding protein n=1 Tax=Nocardia sp. NPDC020380 TaxID=3364309 RepID=UPI0037BB249B
MSDPDNTAEQQESADRARGSQYQIEVHGDATGPVVAGNQNVIIRAEASSVSVLMPGDKPRPARYEHVELLPSRQPTPLGRATELAALAEATRAGGAVQLCGPVGVGKSALLRYAARTFAPGPDGVVFVSAASGEASDLAQQIFEACYDTTGHPYLPMQTELRRLMTGVRVSVYVDDVSLSLEQMRELIDSVPDATFIFAARERSMLDGVTVIELEGLDLASGLKLLTGNRTQPLSDADNSGAEELWKAADGRPLLLKRAAAIAAQPSQRGELPKPSQVSELVPLLVGRLPDVSKKILALLATLEGAELSPSHIGALSDRKDSVAQCERLVRLGLVESTEHGYRSVADIAAVFSDSDAYPIAGLCAYFTQWVQRRNTAPDDVAAAGSALEKVVELAQRAGEPRLAVTVARASSPAMARARRFGMWGRLLGRGWLAAEQAGDRSAATYFMHEEGVRNMVTGRRVIAAALLAEAAARWLELGQQHAATTAINAQRYLPAGQPVTPPLSHNGIGAIPTTGDPTQIAAPAHHPATVHAASSHMTALVPAHSGPPTVSLQLPHYTVPVTSPTVSPAAVHMAANPATATGSAHVGSAPVAAGSGGGMAGAGAGGAGASAAAGTAGLAAFMKAVIGVVVAVAAVAAAPHVIDAIRQAVESASEHGIVGTWEGSSGPLHSRTLNRSQTKGNTVNDKGDRISIHIEGGAYGPVVGGSHNKVENYATADQPAEVPSAGEDSGSTVQQNNAARGSGTIYAVTDGDMHVHQADRSSGE